ncbi:hypothetical protein, partial [Carboxydothermus pertinax]|uniref:hypothetical protein n=1 Tax=Carboxydothermus pertinax TaxID=870242 RepID=UPI001F1FD706
FDISSLPWDYLPRNLKLLNETMAYYHLINILRNFQVNFSLYNSIHNIGLYNKQLLPAPL